MWLLEVYFFRLHGQTEANGPLFPGQWQQEEKQQKGSKSAGLVTFYAISDEKQKDSKKHLQIREEWVSVNKSTETKCKKVQIDTSWWEVDSPREVQTFSQNFSSRET